MLRLRTLPRTKSGAVTKENLLGFLQSLKKKSFTEHFTPIRYKSEGSPYGACGIRIDGNPEFVEAVLSRLTDVLELEAVQTRLELACSTVKAKPGQPLNKCERDAMVCYIRCHERGDEGKMLAAYSQRSLMETA